MNTEDNVFHVTDENGKQIKMEVLFTYDDTEQGLVYIVCTDNTLDDEGNVNTYASYFHSNEDEPRLRVIENDEKWNMTKDILESLNKGEIPD